MTLRSEVCATARWFTSDVSSTGSRSLEGERGNPRTRRTTRWKWKEIDTKKSTASGGTPEPKTDVTVLMWLQHANDVDESMHGAMQSFFFLPVWDGIGSRRFSHIVAAWKRMNSFQRRNNTMARIWFLVLLFFPLVIGAAIYMNIDIGWNIAQLDSTGTHCTKDHMFIFPGLYVHFSAVVAEKSGLRPDSDFCFRAKIGDHAWLPINRSFTKRQLTSWLNMGMQADDARFLPNAFAG